MSAHHLSALAAWRLDHAWMSDSDTRPIADDLAIADEQAADDYDAALGLTRPADEPIEDDA